MTYIICSRRKSMAKVSVEVCEKCPRKRRCPDYAAYIQPSLFSHYRGEANGRIKRHNKKRSIKKPVHESREEQLKLDFS